MEGNPKNEEKQQFLVGYQKVYRNYKQPTELERKDVEEEDFFLLRKKENEEMKETF